jgi:hypothetical protein
VDVLQGFVELNGAIILLMVGRGTVLAYRLLLYHC